jgi:hypothetical protein
LAKQFFFGSTAADQFNQAQYLLDHGLTKVSDANGGTYSLNATALIDDFDYFVQIGNKGTWSVAHVDVVDRPDLPPPVDTHHDGDLVAKWDFENHIADAGDNTGTPSGFWNLGDWAKINPGVYGAEADAFGFTYDIQIHGPDGPRALDTAGSPGNIFLQAVPVRDGVDPASSTMPDLQAGHTYHAEVSVLKQSYPGQVDGFIGTDADASVSFQFNDQILTVKAEDIHVVNDFVTFNINFAGRDGEDDFTIMSAGTPDTNQGLLIDHIQIHEWVI